MRVLSALWNFLRGWGGLLLGGLYTAVLGFKELVKAVDELIFRFWDYRVFEVLDTPRARAADTQMIRTSIGRIVNTSGEYVPTFLKPYSVAELAVRTGRKENSVVASLKRLKRLGKAISSPSGWYSASNAPPISERVYSN